MKKLFLILSFIVLSGLIFAQSDSTHYTYCALIGTHKIIKSEVNVVIDFGQKTTYFQDKRYRDEKGELVTFNSMIDALNFMVDKDWEFVQAFSAGISAGYYNYTYILRKKE